MSALDDFREIAAAHDRCFWLDGGGSQDWSGSRSIMGGLQDDDLSLTYDAVRREVVEHPSGRVVGDDIFTALQDRLDGDADTHWIGYFGYAARPDLPARSQAGLPDAVWMRARSVRVTDGPAPAVPPGDAEVLAGPTPAVYADAFAEVVEQLRSGNSYEVNLTYREELPSSRDPVEIYGRLRSSNPAPYAGVLRHGDVWLLSASPERFATIDRHRRAETRPIKGTTPRGATPELDEELRHRLATDPKFRAENLMITDLLRNDLSMVSDPGSVAVPRLMEVESYASVHQLVSTVTGRLRPEIGTVEALRAMFPAGSMTGAPKLRTMEIIDQVEAEPRGIYAGAFGWISGDGRADLGVVIRSLYRAADGPWRLGTGGGITVRSDVDEEYAETLWKAARLRTALQ
ncbi:anthranilate synthase component I family protein [Nocardioides marmoriginsengisoli]|uniref:Anthranilate synthase component I family protein n=1 Tax=Nocardioides marmoriginsengisoli TaxID=661483 RepID=A0A3N0CBT2_9ACTN|nr:anthranilate synthase component I family protein [Nocardioides marmoriginsengisoli]RNL60526.1 anthranilate synthase component I family protein [Nocardioides marmoriginsengisoli]